MKILSLKGATEVEKDIFEKIVLRAFIAAKFQLILYQDAVSFLLQEERVKEADNIISVINTHLNTEFQSEYIPVVLPFKDVQAFKNGRFVCYIPENGRNGYTKQSFLSLCNGEELIAERIFHLCEWQHPETIVSENIDHGTKDTNQTA